MGNKLICLPIRMIYNTISEVIRNNSIIVFERPMGIQTRFLNWEILMSALKALFNNSFLKSFYRKRKKKTINILTVFFIFYKSSIKIFLKWIINQYL